MNGEALRPHRRLLWLTPFFAVSLIAADPAWKKPVPGWTEEDARQVLANSPWSKTVIAGITPLEGESQRREGGAMGQPTGIGYDGIEDKRPRPSLPKMLSGDITPPSSGSRVIRLMIRWESALPIRAAELKAHETGAPTPAEDGYCIAVYGIPGAFFGDPEKLGNPLKNFAALKREQKKDVKPSQVEVLQLEGGAAVVYLFPLSANLSKEDGSIKFTALIGRLQISQEFNLEDMRFQGKLGL